jgi:3-methyladenine DNA glycosylase AlkD
MVEAISAELRSLARTEIAEHSQQFFKTAKGEYGAGDKFLGVRVPAIRGVVRTHKRAELDDALLLLRSKYHEERLCALLLMVRLYEKGKDAAKEAVCKAYLAHTDRVNNWDLVDSSAEPILGAHLLKRPRDPLYILIESNNLWERRIAIMATHAFIKKNDFTDTLALAELVLEDEHDLIHKASGWMLREVAKRDQAVAETFLRQHCQTMPRTMLRYAIEHFPEKLRQAYLSGDV